MPLQRRLPKRGFTNIFKREYQIINIRDLQKLGSVSEVTPQVLLESGVINKKNVPLKILGVGELKKALNVSANAFSKSAKEKIESAGGKVTVL
jgi:large subunit ribosomal protein L15